MEAPADGLLVGWLNCVRPPFLCRKRFGEFLLHLIQISCGRLLRILMEKTLEKMKKVR